MEAAIDRIMLTYDLLVNRPAAASAKVRARVTDYVTTLSEAGEKDMHRLTVCGLNSFARTRRQRRSGEGGVYWAVDETSARLCTFGDAKLLAGFAGLGFMAYRRKAKPALILCSLQLLRTPKPFALAAVP